jgi:hypothetical protein
MNLINPKILQQRLNNFDFPTGEKAQQITKNIIGWQTALKDHDLSKTKEKEVQGLFLQKFFGEILGYTTQAEGTGEWSLIQHPKSEVDAQEPDGSLGFFTKEEKITKAVIELKDAKTSLDKRQTGREKGYTPIEQASSYALKFDRCNWIILSNFREIRLYSKSRTQNYSERFDVLELQKEAEFKRFYYLLCSKNLISKTHASVIDDLANDTAVVNEDITKKFYNQYKQARLSLFNHLVQQNPIYEKTILLEKAQKIIDRLIFILFCEDTSNLLPRKIVKDTYELGMRSRERNDERVWREFKNLFMDIDLGRDNIDPKINKYNGGLFANDEILNSLKIEDQNWKPLIDLNNYNFESELNVNILGHIFEQSISDLEAIKTSIYLLTEDGSYLTTESGDRLITEQTATEFIEQKGKRKKEGVFYTPDFVTKFLIDDVVGRYLEENQDKLESIKILDPACGSGAFLNQAHTFLMNEYKVRFEERLVAQTKKRQLDISDVDLAVTNKSILLNNLYGVDLNPESVEITKLSLWLKTARATEPLQNLDKNIKCGNSIVDDPEFAGERAFKWKEEFQDIIATGGFDVIIGNPPYVRQEFIKNIKPYLEKTYKVYTGVSDLYVYFFEKALSLLKENGYFAFIVSSKFLRADYGKKLTQYLQQNFTILELIDFGDLQIFEGATTYPCIITIQNKKPSPSQQVKFLKLKSLDAVSDLRMAMKKDGQTILIKQEDESWQLKSIEEKTIMEKIKLHSNMLGTFLQDQIYYGIKTGYNEAFIIDTNTKENLCRDDPKSMEIIKPLLRGKDIKRYTYSWEKLWLIFTRRGTDMSQYPAIKNYLEQFKEKLEPGSGRKPGPYKWYEIQDNIAYYQEFEKPKIIWGNLTLNASFSYDTKNFYISAPACILSTNEKWLIALLNSSVCNFFLQNTAIERNSGFIEQKPIYVSKIPIPYIEAPVKNLLAQKVDEMLKLKNEIHNFCQNSADVLNQQFGINKRTQKLQNFLSLGWNEFVEELEKQHTLFSLQQKDELIIWFRSKQEGYQILEHKIKSINDYIEEEVYKLYLLNNKDKQVILKNIQQKSQLRTLTAV